ncbi:MAG: hypothetical protein SBU_001410 [Candidatus Syntrophoarchaeum butanivorans]|uniref:Uncharacterized protein n=1 Tax=Candidatus Syntropharchaeum butanivorans TaxID=1839936 RepID=A0A1F2P373_9EURY|nr:MAG: hypothetical protein SBU_001410 [Candidatus Syntrophoarchaeum butanivorans]
MFLAFWTIVADFCLLKGSSVGFKIAIDSTVQMPFFFKSSLSLVLRLRVLRSILHVMVSGVALL